MILDEDPPGPQPGSLVVQWPRRLRDELTDFDSRDCCQDRLSRSCWQPGAAMV